MVCHNFQQSCITFFLYPGWPKVMGTECGYWCDCTIYSCTIPLSCSIPALYLSFHPTNALHLLQNRYTNEKWSIATLSRDVVNIEISLYDGHSKTFVVLIPFCNLFGGTTPIPKKLEPKIKNNAIIKILNLKKDKQCILLRIVQDQHINC